MNDVNTTAEGEEVHVWWLIVLLVRPLAAVVVVLAVTQ